MWEHRRPEAGFFTPKQKSQIAVLLDGIFPPGPRNPGASDCGAADYLDYLLAAPSVYYEIAQWQTTYASALPWLDKVAQQRFMSALDTLSPQQCTALLNDLSAGKLPNAPVGLNQAQFFAILRSHCIEGCFADRRWGGNRENIIWQWYGYPSGPSCNFDRTKKPPLEPCNTPPPQTPPLSGNSATASKDPLLNQSATVSPILLSQAINAEHERRKSTALASGEEPEVTS
jgi:gluconate 2-dehydrogenase gamma chain